MTDLHGRSTCPRAEARGKLGPKGKFLFFVLATFYLDISSYKSRNFELWKSKFRLKKVTDPMVNL